MISYMLLFKRPIRIGINVFEALGPYSSPQEAETDFNNTFSGIKVEDQPELKDVVLLTCYKIGAKQ